jgi:hypothetical protein
MAAPFGKRCRMCLGGTRRNVQQSNPRATGVKINWIVLDEGDYHGRLQKSIAARSPDFDLVEMAAPFEGDLCGRGLASEMPNEHRGPAGAIPDRPASRRPGSSGVQSGPARLVNDTLMWETGLIVGRIVRAPTAVKL